MAARWDPFDAWPTGGGGFEYFYGFIGGDTHQYYPAVIEGTTAIEPDKTPEEGYHFTEDMTNKAINWARQQKALMPDNWSATLLAPARSRSSNSCVVLPLARRSRKRASLSSEDGRLWRLSFRCLAGTRPNARPDSSPKRNRP